MRSRNSPRFISLLVFSQVFLTVQTFASEIQDLNLQRRWVQVLREDDLEEKKIESARSQEMKYCNSIERTLSRMAGERDSQSEEILLRELNGHVKALGEWRMKDDVLKSLPPCGGKVEDFIGEAMALNQRTLAVTSWTDMQVIEGLYQIIIGDFVLMTFDSLGLKTWPAHCPFKKLCSDENDASVDFSQVSREDVRQRLAKTWGDRREGSEQRALLYLPRLTSRLVSNIFTGFIAQRCERVPKAIPVLGSDSFLETHDRLAESLFSLGTVNAFISDLAVEVKELGHATVRRAQRIEFCTLSNMTLTASMRGEYERDWESLLWAIADPNLHVALRIDQADILGTTQFFSSELSCVPIPIYADISESLLIEKLLILNAYLTTRQRYAYFGNNCGNLVSDLMDLTGLGHPSFVNLGIGAEWNFKKDEENYEDYFIGGSENLLKTLEVHSIFLRRLFAQLEEGGEVDVMTRLYFLTASYHRILPSGRYAEPSPDVLLQALASSVRGGNPESLSFVAKVFGNNRWNRHILSENVKSYKSSDLPSGKKAAMDDILFKLEAKDLLEIIEEGK